MTTESITSPPLSASNTSDSERLELRSRRGLDVAEDIVNFENSALCLNISCTLTPRGSSTEMVGFQAKKNVSLPTTYDISILSASVLVSCSRLNGRLSLAVDSADMAPKRIMPGLDLFIISSSP